MLSNHDPSFSLANYSCLVTRYRDGNSFIPAHSDDEHCIAQDSTIYTVSIGAERTLLCHSIGVPLTEHSYKLTEGSIQAMSRESQSRWQHSVPPEPSCTSTRVSFTFRRMDPAAVPPPRRSVPPIRENAIPSRPLAPNKRVLFLTDSVNCGLKTHLFHGSGLTCIKKPDFFELSSINDYVKQFQYTDYVVISAGVNDISRYGHSAESVSGFICSKIRDWVRRFPNPTFILNSILSTDYLWLNRRIKTVNKALFDLSIELYDSGRVYFLDTHARVLDARGTQILMVSSCLSKLMNVRK